MMAVDKFGRGSRTPLRGLPGAGFKLTAGGNFDISNKQLKNVAKAMAAGDAVNKKLLDENITILREKHNKSIDQLFDETAKLAVEIDTLKKSVGGITSYVLLVLQRVGIIDPLTTKLPECKTFSSSAADQ